MKLIIALALFTTSVAAQDGPQAFTLPAGCTAFLTVQSNACVVDHHFTCDGDPAGNQRRISLDEQGMTYMGTIDAQTQWLDSYHPLNNHTETLESDPIDRASIDELIETGIDTYDFQTLSDEIGVTRYVGADLLTGRQIEIDGISLSETTYDITAYSGDGTFLWSSKGHEFISRDWRMFLSGSGVIKTPTDEYDDEDTPVEFVFPGEPGFLSPNPKYGCGVMMSKMAINQ